MKKISPKSNHITTHHTAHPTEDSCLPLPMCPILSPSKSALSCVIRCCGNGLFCEIMPWGGQSETKTCTLLAFKYIRNSMKGFFLFLDDLICRHLLIANYCSIRQSDSNWVMILRWGNCKYIYHQRQKTVEMKGRFSIYSSEKPNCLQTSRNNTKSTGNRLAQNWLAVEVKTGR